MSEWTPFMKILFWSGYGVAGVIGCVWLLKNSEDAPWNADGRSDRVDACSGVFTVVLLMMTAWPIVVGFLMVYGAMVAVFTAIFCGPAIITGKRCTNQADRERIIAGWEKYRDWPVIGKRLERAAGFIALEGRDAYGDDSG